MIVSLSEAKAKLSKLVDLVYHGEKVTIAKNNLPVADLVPHKPRGKRQLGLLRGRIEIADDFDAPSEEIEALFYGEKQ